MKKCKGPCGRDLPEERFEKSDGYRRNVCHTCRRNGKLARRRIVNKPAVMPDVAAADPDQPNDTPVEQLPVGHYVWGVTTKVDSGGNIKEQYIKTRVEPANQEAALKRAIEYALELPRLEPIERVTRPEHLNRDMLAVVPMGDPHLGMLAWAPETGEHFDLAIATRQLFAAADYLIELAPPCGEALLINAGDFFHADSDKSTTYKGTPVDVDGRYTKMYTAGIGLMCRIIDRLLQKFERVTVINEIGNHDTQTALMLAICLDAMYKHEPRVKIDTSPEPFHWYKFGRVFLGTHHGDKVKVSDLPLLMACDRAEEWGATKHRHFYVGHVHHDTLKELPGCTVETLRTLAAKDKWHHGQGYRSGRDLKIDFWHREHGYQGRQVIDISLVKVLTNDV